MANQWDNFHENMGDESAALHMSGAFDKNVGHDHDPALPGRGAQISYNSLKDKPTTIAHAEHAETATHAESATLAEAAKFDTRFSITGCIGGSADRQVFSEDSFEAQQIRRNIPSGKKLVIKRASYDLVPAASETELYLFVECSGGTGDWLSTTDAGDNSLDVTLCSNTTGSTFEVTIRIWIISGYPGGIKPQSGWSVEFAIEDV